MSTKKPRRMPGLTVERAPSNLQKTSELPVAYLLLSVPKRILLQLSVGVACSQPITGSPVFFEYLSAS